MANQRLLRLVTLVFVVTFAAALLVKADVSSPQPLGGELFQAAKSPTRVPPGPFSVRVALPGGAPAKAVLARVGARWAYTEHDGVATFDGLPAGDYEACIAAPGFERVSWNAKLPEGKREGVKFALAEAAEATLSGFVTIGATSAPAAGIPFHLEPVTVPATVHGAFDFHTDWQGRFVVRAIPVGLYRVTAKAAGLEPLDAELKIQPNMAPVHWQLQPVIEEGNARIMVKDAKGKPVVGATVVLSEAWPKAEYARAKTDDQGAASFPQLRYAQVTRAEDEAAALLGRRFGVRVEAPGFAPGCAICVRAARVDATVVLQSNAPQEESEPNDKSTEANELHLGAPTTLKIGKGQDVDAFRVNLANDAQLQVEIDLPAIDTKLALLEADGRLVSEMWEYGGRTLKQRFALRAGAYLLQISARSPQATSNQPLTLRANATWAPDLHEPNEAGSMGSLVAPRQQVHGYLFPADDVDTFRLNAPAAGVARFRIPKAPVDVVLKACDGTGQELAAISEWAQREVILEVHTLKPREILLSVQVGRSGEGSTNPYRLECDWIAADASPQLGQKDSARPLRLDSLVGATTCPAADVDRWRVDLPCPGMMHVECIHPFEHRVRLLNARGDAIATSWDYAERKHRVTQEIHDPQTIFVEVENRNSGEFSGSPYTLRTWFLPCDEHERAACNDLPAFAAPVEAGETVRGALSQAKDVDCYRLVAETAGRLAISGMCTHSWRVKFLDSKGRELASSWEYGGKKWDIGIDISAGDHVISIEKRDAGSLETAPYSFDVRLERVEPGETEDVKADPIRELKEGVAQAWVLDRESDLDRFRATASKAGKYWLSVYAPLWTYVRITEEGGGNVLADTWMYDGALKTLIEAKGPAKYLIEFKPREGRGRATAPGFVMFAGDEKPFASAVFAPTTNPLDPTLVTFECKAAPKGEPVASFGVDINRDGTLDASSSGPALSFRVADEGNHVIDYELKHANGVVSRGSMWICAVGARERSGVHVSFAWPAANEVVDQARPCRAVAVSYSGLPISRVLLEVDGQQVASDTSAPFELDVPWRSLGRGEHTLKLTAFDNAGKTGIAERRVSISRFLDLTPMDNAEISSKVVRVSWYSPEFGPAVVRYRESGQEAWQTVQGDNGRARVVALTGIPAGRLFEFQPLDGDTPGPLRVFRRVQGLAFGKSRYGANIKRAYDQRVGISVRNDAQAAMTVRLECHAPKEGLLLAGFVGEGSEGTPVRLEPGEEREFLLGLSAQDVVTERHVLPIRIASDNGYSDEAEVEVLVKLPEVNLEWQDAGVLEDGLGRRFWLVNRGDTVTDLDVASDSKSIVVSPAIVHALLKQGERIEIIAQPSLEEGFTAAEARLFATAVGKESATAVKVALPAGEQIYGVPIVPGGSNVPGPDDYERARLAARALAGPYLLPELVDWSKRENPQDSNGDGRPDRWTVVDKRDRILWVGSDTSGDGEIDFVSADIGYDGVFEHSSMRTETGWEPTNLVEAWLETSFSLPWSRDHYEKHDLQLLLNGRMIGEFKDSLPEGNYAFRIPPAALQFNEDGAPLDANIEICSDHLRGGHYVVNSDFRIKLKLTGTRVFVSAKDMEEARQKARSAKGISFDGTDYSVSSSDVEILMPEGGSAGKRVMVRATVRNFGATNASAVPVALMRALPGQRSIELARLWIEDDGRTDTHVIQIPWTVAAGTHTLQVVVDPDCVLPEVDRDNNIAIAALSVPGDDAKPTLKLNFADGSEIDGSILPLTPVTGDDSGISKVEARVDGGLWQPLDPANGGKALLQPGPHQVDVRVTDSSGNQVVQSAKVNSKAQAPQFEVLEPTKGANVSGRKADVALRTPPGAKLASARVNGGPWKRLPIDENNVAAGTVPVAFGDADIETLVIDCNGVRATQHVPVLGADRSVADENPSAVAASDGTIDVPGFGTVDAFGDANAISAPTAAGASGTAAAGSRSLRPARSILAYKRQQSWYCTNRPHIGVKFQMPDWLRKKKLPRPGTKEFTELERKLLEALRAQGIDTSKLENFQGSLLRRIATMEQPGELPGFLESLGLVKTRPSGLSKAELEVWRDQMRERAMAWWLRLLASGNADFIADGLKARAEALQNFDEAMREHAEAAVETITANQQLTEDVLSAIPLVGEAIDLIAIATGESLAGETLSIWGRLFRASMVLGPIGLEEILKRSPDAQQAFSAVVERMSQLGDSAKRSMLEALGLGADDMTRAVSNMSGAIGKNRNKLMGTLDEAADSARIGWKYSRAGLEDTKVWRQANDTAQQRISKLTDAIDPKTGKILNPEGFERAMLEIQKDKLAQNLLNKAAGEQVDLARKAMKEQMENVLYRDVDRAVNAALESSDDVLDLARKNGLNTKIDPATGKHVPDGWKVEPMNVSNTGGKPGSKTSIGRDRDVTYQIVGVDGNGAKVKIDIHHDLSKPAYAEEFFKRTHGGKLPDVENPALRQKLLDQNLDLHDQMVTSKWHPEAYNAGEVPLSDFLDRGVTPTLTRPSDIRDTFIFKSDHWFHRAERYSHDAAEYGKSMAEGMRQATKQWDNQIVSRIKQYSSLEKAPGIPVHLEKAIDIMRQVDDLKISPQQAESMLAALPVRGGVKLTPQSVVGQMGSYLEGLEKTAGEAYRKLGTKRLNDTLSAIPNSGSNNWTQGSLDALNNALRNGEISGETFTRRRSSVISGRVQAARNTGTKQGWQDLDAWLQGIPQGRLLSPVERRALALLAKEEMNK